MAKLPGRNQTQDLDFHAFLPYSLYHFLLAL
jgi:hypothetical protein